MTTLERVNTVNVMGYHGTGRHEGLPVNLRPGARVPKRTNLIGLTGSGYAQCSGGTKGSFSLGASSCSLRPKAFAILASLWQSSSQA
jgi:hypothetical protein